MRMIKPTSWTVMLCLALMIGSSFCVATAPTFAESAAVSPVEVDALKTELAHVKTSLESTQKALESL
jgi:hypothetical protein